MNIIEIFENTPDILQDREKIKTLFYATFDIRAKANLMLMAYDEGILDIMKKAYPLNEDMQHDFVKHMCRDFCIPEAKAEYTVKLWSKLITPHIAEHFGFRKNRVNANFPEGKTVTSDKKNEMTSEQIPKKRTDWIEEYEESIVLFCGNKEYGAFNNDGIVLNWLINCRLGVKGKDTFATFPDLSFIEEVLITRHVSYIVIKNGKKIKERTYADNHYSLFLSKAISTSKSEDGNSIQRIDDAREETEEKPNTKDSNEQTEGLSPKDRALFEARQRVAKGEGNLPAKTKPLHECKDCMLYRNETCFGNNKICEDFRFAPTIPKEEMDLWPKMGDASFFRLGGRYR